MKRIKLASLTRWAVLIALGLLATLLGCAGPALKSHRVAKPNELQKGVSYFLPRVLVQILADQQTLRITNGVRTNIVANITNAYSRVVVATNSIGTTNLYTSATIDTNAYTVQPDTDITDKKHQYAVTLN